MSESISKPQTTSPSPTPPLSINTKKTSSPLSSTTTHAITNLANLTITPSPTSSTDLSSRSVTPSPTSTPSRASSEKSLSPSPLSELTSKITNLSIANQTLISKIIDFQPTGKTYTQNELVNLGNMLATLPRDLASSIPEVQAKKEDFFKEIHSLSFIRRNQQTLKDLADAEINMLVLGQLAFKISKTKYHILPTEDSASKSTTGYQLIPDSLNNLDRFKTTFNMAKNNISTPLRYVLCLFPDEAGDAAHSRLFANMVRASEEVNNFKMNERAEWKNAAENLLELSQDLFDNHRIARSLKPAVYNALQEQLAKPENLQEQQQIIGILEDLQQKDKEFPEELTQVLNFYT